MQAPCQAGESIKGLERQDPTGAMNVEIWAILYDVMWTLTDHVKVFYRKRTGILFAVGPGNGLAIAIHNLGAVSGERIEIVMLNHVCVPLRRDRFRWSECSTLAEQVKNYFWLTLYKKSWL